MAISIFQNISLIISIALVYHFVARQLHGKPHIVLILNGLFLGSTAILAMLMPFRFSSGIIYDGRTIILAVAGLFGGPIVVGIASTIALLFRIFVVGGNGWLAGSATIILASGMGLSVYYWRRKNPGQLTAWRILALGYAVHILMLTAQLLLPDSRWKSIIPVIAFPVLLIYPLAFYFICKLFLDDEERTKNQRLLEESEARYKLLFQNHHSIMLLIDLDTGRIVDANPAAEAFYGWEKVQLLSMEISEISALPFERIQEHMTLALEGKKYSFLARHRLASGDIRDVETFSGPIEFFGKKVLYSIVNDISARVQAENEVRQLNQTMEQRVAKRTQELQDANRELEAFAYSVSHDLRAPLRAIEGFSSLLCKETGTALTGDESGHYLDRIRYNAAKMNRLIDDLLRLSRISRQALQFSSIDLSQLAREAWLEISSQNPDRKVSFDIQENMTVRADKALLEMVLVNLFGNAWKFTASVPEAVIRFESMDSGGERVYCVSDNGVGFDMAYADKLFSPFQRLHPEQEYGGSGIGLSIVRRIVARHGGKIWAKSAPSEGATFFFTLGG